MQWDLLTMREYKSKTFSKAQLQRENKKLTGILQALRNCHKALGTINGGEEKTLAIAAIVYAFEQVNILREFKGKAAARGLPNETILNAEFESAIEVLADEQ